MLMVIGKAELMLRASIVLDRIQEPSLLTELEDDVNMKCSAGNR